MSTKSNSKKSKTVVKQETQPATQNEISSKPWWKETIIIVLALVFVFLIGIVMVWVSDWQKKTKVIVTIVSTALWILFVAFIGLAASMAPPVIELKNKNNTTVTNSEYKVEGSVTPTHSKVEINGTNIDINPSYGYFGHTVQLKDGRNEIVVSATNAGNRTVVKMYVTKKSAEEIAKENAEAARLKAEAEAKAQAEAAAKAQAEAAAKAPIVLSGSGQQATTKFRLTKGLKVFKMTHQGSGNFAIWLLNSNGDKIDLLVNEIGNFDGSKAVKISQEADYLLDVSAGGSWTVTIEK